MVSFSEAHGLVYHEVPLQDLLPELNEDIIDMRRHLVNQVCTVYYPGNLTGMKSIIRSLNLRNILVDDTRKILYCMVPKAACTNWIRTLAFTSTNISLFRLKQIYIHPDLDMAQVNHNTVWPRDKLRTYFQTFPQLNLHTPNFNRAVGLTSLNYYNVDGIIHRINNYFKFMFVRHPFERLLSAYRDKFERDYDKPFHRIIGTHIVKNFRKNPDKKSLDEGNNVKFEEFIKYMLDRDKKKQVQNAHWMPYLDLCHPCLFKYDVIGKLETIESDARHILKRLTNSSRDHRFLDSKYGPRSNLVKTAAILRLYYDRIPTEAFYSLRRIFDMDFLMFGYNLWP